MKVYEERAKRTGVKPGPLLSRPKLEAPDLPFMRAYDALDMARTWGMSAPNPISLAEIEAYCNLSGIAFPRARLKYLSLIQRLDQVYLAHWAEKNNKG